MRYTHSKITNPGGRSHNEDSAHILQFDGSLIAVVADGLGGEGGGEIASRTAVRATSEFIERSPLFTTENVDAAIKHANDSVINAQKSFPAMKTTVVLLYIGDALAVCGHLGDSRLYHLRGDEIIFQTKDHSVSQMAALVGEISQEDIRHHTDRNKVLRALGAAGSAVPESKVLSAQNGDGFLLCSDGFWELVLEDEMVTDFVESQNAEQWLKKMLAKVESRLTAYGDNYSAITVMAV